MNIIELALQAGINSPDRFKLTVNHMATFRLEKFAALVEAAARADEREECAKLCDDLLAPDIYTDTDKSMWDVTCTDCAAAIRARGTT